MTLVIENSYSNDTMLNNTLEYNSRIINNILNLIIKRTIRIVFFFSTPVS